MHFVGMVALGAFGWLLSLCAATARGWLALELELALALALLELELELSSPAHIRKCKQTWYFMVLRAPKHSIAARVSAC